MQTNPISEALARINGDQSLWPPPILPVPACRICDQPAPEFNWEGRPVCAEHHAAIARHELKRAARANRLRERAEKVEGISEADWQRARDMQSIIPYGQPILIGHHSQRRDERYRDRIERTMQRAWEASKEADELARRARAAESNRAISSDDPAAILKYEQKRDGLMAEQERMKATNAAIRKVIGGPVARLQRTSHVGTLAEINARFRAEKERVAAIHAGYITKAPELAALLNISVETAERLLTPDAIHGGLGYPAYLLSNNSAEIRRIQKRIDELEAARTTVAENAKESIYGDIVLERNAEDNRLRLHFPGKPAPAIIQALKARGFKWSPTNMAWQRFLNADSEYAAHQIIKLAQETK